MSGFNEIGSEFGCLTDNKGKGIILPNDSNYAFVFSGRTAIETVLKNIPNVKKAMLPSYCCESMIIPFHKSGIEVVFYDVCYKDGLNIKVDIADDVDILLWCNYFGFRLEMSDISSFKERGGIVIEDITHSFLSEDQYHKQADYLVASLRKWEPINSGGYCAATKGKLQYIPDTEPSNDFIRIKQQAMKLKAEYLIDHDELKKPEFLRMFGESNSWLAENYSGLSIDSWSKEYLSTVDIQRQREVRCSNAQVLYGGLKGKVQFLFPEESMDCPLFVPILLRRDRDRIRRGLTENSIYCPIHWPKPPGCESNLYDMELSLICDQRYNEEDMMRIVTVLKELI